MKTLSTVALTTSQQQLIALIASNIQKPLNISQVTASHPNLIGARNVLMNLNAITYNDRTKQYSITDIGTQLAIDNDVVDDAGNLTNKGQQVLSVVAPANGSQQPQNNEFDMELPPMEGFSVLFKTLLIE